MVCRGRAPAGVRALGLFEHAWKRGIGHPIAAFQSTHSSSLDARGLGLNRSSNDCDFVDHATRLLLVGWKQLSWRA